MPAHVDTGFLFQEKLALARLKRLPENLDKYDYLMRLYDTDRKSFFRLINRYPGQIMPLVYTPTVGAACQEYSLVSANGR